MHKEFQMNIRINFLTTSICFVKCLSPIWRHERSADKMIILFELFNRPVKNIRR